MKVYIVIQLYGGNIDSVEVFRFEQDADTYYESLGGDAWQENDNADGEVRRFTVDVRSMPVEGL